MCRSERHQRGDTVIRHRKIGRLYGVLARGARIAGYAEIKKAVQVIQEVLNADALV